MKTLALAIILAASSAIGGTVFPTLSASQDAAFESLRAKENAGRAARLSDLNKQRDAKAVPMVLTAAQAEALHPGIGYRQLSRDEYALALLATSLAKEVETLEADAAQAKRAAAEAVVEAIKTRSVDCSDKATTAGLDPLKVCAK